MAMKIFIKSLIITLLIVCAGWLAEILLFANMFILFAPFFILIQLLLAFSGLFYLPFLLIKILYKKTISQKELRQSAIIIGVFLGNYLISPLHQLNDEWRNEAGQLIVKTLTAHYQQFKRYPQQLENLSVEDKAQLNQQLPLAYPLKRFRFSGQGNKYFFYTTGYFMFDKWIWNKETQQFDFYP